DVEREGGEGGEAAENAGGDEQAEFVRGVETARQQLDEEAHGQRAGYVDGHRAPWEGRAEQPQRQTVDEMTRGGSDGAAGGDEEDVEHGQVVPVPPRRVNRRGVVPARQRPAPSPATDRAASIGWDGCAHEPWRNRASA